MSVIAQTPSQQAFAAALLDPSRGPPPGQPTPTLLASLRLDLLPPITDEWTHGGIVALGCVAQHRRR